MREIKFRAWDPESKKMHADIGICGKTLMPDADSGNFFKSMSCNSLNSGIKYMQDYAGLVIMQFTGLYDSKGKEIYEGDVVEHGHIGSKWLVHFHAAKFITLNCDPQNPPYVKAEPLSENCTIIGNRYEHPHLVPEAK